MHVLYNNWYVAFNKCFTGNAFYCINLCNEMQQNDLQNRLKQSDNLLTN